MDQARRDALTAELDDARKERDRLTVYMETLAARLGISLEPGPTQETDQQTPASSSGLVDDVLSLVHDNELHGNSMPKAAATVLARWSPDPYTRPIKTTDLVRALKKGGVDVKESRQIYRALYSNSRFYNVGRGQWGFAKWYPASIRAKGSKGTNASDDADAAPADDQGEPMDPGQSGNDLPPETSEGEPDRKDTEA